ncbi:MULTISPECIES: 8-amino-7-oxononanoate synthase [unclassified Undibacterium]|uniref:8-amino-7-oxononanoate synthase n=1 Tax=unclassified Undibacterium TaxID=2630295 RepID=UPI002AC928B3|nr:MULTISPECIES: 8-amino-7-oxononanoate synthase [unclassified Undibacterium]MEB0138933.1 8-amino-7-oxononanoate synthase [Undibacterium sp. CCC2.1]MEB0171736.1 8-amino-7-oxononanoate synthase [Undibacterium sp. CCC1.1]MEB0175564.1 8-amino-7-oxononanoate synthase [Undibacterium sp. CCC3.4]MEB0214938.1 8-amino-7-oxononanoate synthase [Undibacterium sp. 5I2]WPX45607.1 8-amino-7-oxononanoate synthase [Undibacterium sp. CCC3.4]
MPLLQTLQTELAALDAQHLIRRRRAVDSACDATVQAEGRELMAFCSNDYLGLAAHPAVIAALQQGASLYGAGSGASHLISGHSRAHAQLEERLAEFMAAHIEQARALYFCSGYMANQAVITALAGKDAAVFSEQLNHASLIDGARLSRAATKVFPHRDYDALAEMLKTCQSKQRIVITDSVFSMDGNIADLRPLLALCEQYEAWLIVDDAHGFGVLGAHGRGVFEHFDLHSPNLIYMGTLGKAAGVGGAFVAAHETVIEWLVQKARSYIYTTAAPPALAHALLTSLDIIAGPEGMQRRAHLNQLIDLFRTGLDLKVWSNMPSPTAVQPVLIGDNAGMLAVAGNLRDQGFWVGAIRPPTVAVGTARLRVTLSAAHSKVQVLQLVQAINRLDNLHYVARCFAEVA